MLGNMVSMIALVCLTSFVVTVVNFLTLALLVLAPFTDVSVNIFFRVHVTASTLAGLVILIETIISVTDMGEGCHLLFMEVFFWCAVATATFNLVACSIDRIFAILHSETYRKRWVLFLCIAMTTIAILVIGLGAFMVVGNFTNKCGGPDLLPPATVNIMYFTALGTWVAVVSAAPILYCVIAHVRLHYALKNRRNKDPKEWKLLGNLFGAFRSRPVLLTTSLMLLSLSLFSIIAAIFVIVSRFVLQISEADAYAITILIALFCFGLEPLIIITSSPVLKKYIKMKWQEFLWNYM